MAARHEQSRLDELGRAAEDRVLVLDREHAVARGEAPADGMPLFADGMRSAQIVEAVLASAREQAWVDVPAVAAEVTP